MNFIQPKYWSYLSSLLVLACLFSCVDDTPVLNSDPKDTTLVAPHPEDSVPHSQNDASAEEWNSKSHTSSAAATPEQLALFDEDNDLVATLSVDFLGEVYKRESFKVLAFGYASKGCPTVCPHFTRLVSVDPLNVPIDRLDITDDGIEYDIQIKIKANSLRLDSTYYNMTEEEGIPYRTGTTGYGSKHYKISETGKFVAE